MDDKRIGVRRRGRALLVDAGAIFLLWFAASLATQALAMSPAAGMSGAPLRGRHLGIWFLLLLTPPMVGVGYAACDVFFAATPGKMLLKLRIADAAGRRATRGQLLARFAIKFGWLLALAGWIAYFSVSVALTDGRSINAATRLAVPMLTLIGLLGVAVGVGGLWAFKSSRQALHDRFTGTAVFARDDVTTSSFEPILETDATRATPMARA